MSVLQHQKMNTVILVFIHRDLYSHVERNRYLDTVVTKHTHLYHSCDVLYEWCTGSLYCMHDDGFMICNYCKNL